mmetsp:Transcript_21455/g.81736  ORF Transcript_21455/g.81736 Transcript_21455/m.81736 type:complete len:297 (-) Transcript_21455:1686-2576(-)
MRSRGRGGGQRSGLVRPQPAVQRLQEPPRRDAGARAQGRGGAPNLPCGRGGPVAAKGRLRPVGRAARLLRPHARSSSVVSRPVGPRPARRVARSRRPLRSSGAARWWRLSSALSRSFGRPCARGRKACFQHLLGRRFLVRCDGSLIRLGCPALVPVRISTPAPPISPASRRGPAPCAGGSESLMSVPRLGIAAAPDRFVSARRGHRKACVCSPRHRRLCQLPQQQGGHLKEHSLPRKQHGRRSSRNVRWGFPHLDHRRVGRPEDACRGHRVHPPARSSRRRGPEHRHVCRAHRHRA